MGFMIYTGKAEVPLKWLKRLRLVRCHMLRQLMSKLHGHNPRSPGTHVVGPWVIDTINLYRDLRAGTQHVSNWASRVSAEQNVGTLLRDHTRIPV